MTTDTLATRTATQLSRRGGFDPRGCPVSTGSADAIAHAEQAQQQLLSYGDPLGALAAAAQADPQWALPHVMQANALASMTEHGLAGAAAASLQAAIERAPHANERERAHIVATRAALDGRWLEACAAWEAILVDHPQDVHALGIAHLFDFYRGDARNLQRRVARVLPEWSPSAPLYSYVLGLHAFGLEECNLYAQAIDAGQAALALERRDPWAVHAVAHVHEMQGQFDAGAAWLASRRADWAGGDNAIAYHLWWHLALFQLERCDTAAALALLDERVTPGAETALQRIDVTALLWRLRLMGVEVGTRWDAIADAWSTQPPEAGHYAFNDFHAALAQIGAGRLDAAARVLDAVQGRSREASTPGAMADEVGVPLLRGLLAGGRGRHGEAVDALWAVRDRCHRFGGSHAQRDLIDQTLLDAAIRAGRDRLARHLLNERLLAKCRSPLTEHWAQRIG